MEPKIRFKGFEGEWKTPSIGEVFELRNGYTPSKAVNEFWEGGTIPWFRMEDIRTNGGILKDAIQHITPLAVKGAGLFEKNSIILATTATIGVHAMLIADSLANQQFTNFRVRKSLSDSYIDNFLYYSFFNIDEWSKKNTNSGGLLSVNMPLLVKQPLYSPCKQEQQAIASYFTSLDSQISASTSRLASLKQMKAASLQAMFPQEGETVPKIRFKGFEGEWKKVKADSIFKTFNEKNRPDLPVLSATQDRGMVTRESIGYNIFHDTSNEATYKHILPGQFVIHLRSFQGGFAHSEIEGIASPAYTIMDFKNKDLYHDYYWRYVFMSKEFIKRLELITYGIRDGRSISYDEFKEMSFLVPSKEEQIKIASYLKNLDRQISLQSQRLEKLKQIKSACLDKMFV